MKNTIDRFNVSRFNEHLSSSTPTTVSENLRYTLEVQNRNGTLLAYLPLWNNASYTQTFSDIGKLQFEYPALDTNAQYLNYPNRIILRDLYGNIIEQYFIVNSESIQSDVEYKVIVQCESLFYQLQNEIVPNLEIKDTDNKTISYIISLLLNSYQKNSKPIYCGSIDSAFGSLTRSISLKGQSIFEAIKQLYASVDTGGNSAGCIYVNPNNRQFYWRTKAMNAQNIFQQIRVSKNMLGISYTEDPSLLVNRIYIYGEGNANTDSTNPQRVSLKTLGYPNEYIENSSSIATYGILPKYITLKNITKNSASIIGNIATSKLAKYSTLFHEYKINVADLYGCEPTKYSFERFEIGSTVRIINEDLNILHDDIVYSITKQLDNPIEIQITLSNKKPTFEDLAKNLSDRITALENSSSPALNDVVPSVITYGTVSSAGSSLNAMRGDATFAVDTSSFDNAMVSYDTSSWVNTGKPYVDNRINTDVSSMISSAVSAIPRNYTATTTPSAIQYTAAIGTDTSHFANADHIHKGIQLFDSSSMGSLTNTGSIDITAIGIAKNSGSNQVQFAKRNYSNNAWVSMHGAMVVANYASIPSDNEIGALYFTLDSSTTFIRDSTSSFRILHPIVKVGAPDASVFGPLREGMKWIDSSNHKEYTYLNSSWVCISHYA